jgi:hypothetical protein
MMGSKDPKVNEVRITVSSAFLYNLSMTVLMMLGLETQTKPLIWALCDITQAIGRVQVGSIT